MANSGTSGASTARRWRSVCNVASRTDGAARKSSKANRREATPRATTKRAPLNPRCTPKIATKNTTMAQIAAAHGRLRRYEFSLAFTHQNSTGEHAAADKNLL